MADDLKVGRVFEQVKLNAKQQKHFDKSNSKESIEYSRKSGHAAKELVYSLKKPDELVSLIRLCKKARRNYDAPKFESISEYFISCEEFGIQKLGEMQTPEALKALEVVHEIEAGQEGIMETWDDARAKYPKAN
jgi:hypothetical protein